MGISSKTEEKYLENAEKNIHQIEEHPNYMAHIIYAMFLLAQFREKRAYPLIVDLFSHPGETSDHIGGEFVCEDLPRVLASVCYEGTTLIKQLIENEKVDEYVRDAGLKALLILVVNVVIYIQKRSTKNDVHCKFIDDTISDIWNGGLVFSQKRK